MLRRPAGGVGGEGRIGRLRSLEKMPPKYAIFSTVLSKIVDLKWPFQDLRRLFSPQRR